MTATTANDVDAKMQLAVAAQEAGNWETALTYARSALALSAMVPSGGHGPVSLQWNTTVITQFMDRIERAQLAAQTSAAGGIQQTLLRPKRVCA